MSKLAPGQLALIRKRAYTLVDLSKLDTPSAVLYRETWANGLRRMFPELSETQAHYYILRAVAVKRGQEKSHV